MHAHGIIGTQTKYKLTGPGVVVPLRMHKLMQLWQMACIRVRSRTAMHQLKDAPRAWQRVPIGILYLHILLSVRVLRLAL